MSQRRTLEDHSFSELLLLRHIYVKPVSRLHNKKIINFVCLSNYSRNQTKHINVEKFLTIPLIFEDVENVFKDWRPTNVICHNVIPIHFKVYDMSSYVIFISPFVFTQTDISLPHSKIWGYNMARLYGYGLSIFGDIQVLISLKIIKRPHKWRSERRVLIRNKVRHISFWVCERFLC